MTSDVDHMPAVKDREEARRLREENAGLRAEIDDRQSEKERMRHRIAEEAGKVTHLEAQIKDAGRDVLWAEAEVERLRDLVRQADHLLRMGERTRAEMLLQSNVAEGWRQARAAAAQTMCDKDRYGAEGTDG